MKDDAEILIDFETFVLPFMADDTSNDTEKSDEDGGEEDDDDEEEEEEYSREEALDAMQQKIPRGAIQLGETEGEVDNWTSWEIDDHYYLLPWEGGQFDWALIRISWDDNWGRYDWESCARISGVSNPTAAARVMVEKLFDKWGIDLNDSENEFHRNFLDSI